MRADPLISIIVPVYNTRKWLHRCIESLSLQSYRNIEILLVDDGSTDGSERICDEWARTDNRIRVFHLQNQGVSNARNFGIDNSSGDYLCFVDSDDYVDFSYIANFISGLENDTDLVFQGINESHNNGERVRKIPVEQKYEFPFILDGISDINRFSMFGYVCNKLYLKRILTDHQLYFRTDINISEDRIFALRYLRFVKKMNVVGAASYYYNLTPSGLTFKQRNYQEIKTAADENLNEALFLLNLSDSERFLRDTKRMYVMSALTFLSALFRQKHSFRFKVREFSDFKRNYRSWIKYYTPIAGYQKVIYSALSFPPFIAAIYISSYWNLKNFYEKVARISPV